MYILHLPVELRCCKCIPKPNKISAVYINVYILTYTAYDGYIAH